MQKKIYLAGGCFWGTEKVFQSLNGVTDTTVGYANGHKDNPSYEEVKKDNTGHRETVEVVYDDEVISLPTIMTAYFMCIDPTVENRQAHDIGTQYQTGVYYCDDSDLPVLEEIFEQEKKKYPVFHVELLPLKVFWPAEEYHQDYLDKNPNGYCHITTAEYEAVKKLNDR
ncbi:MAG: peptide-methionine (S)-S-oxide reductase MsrA [Erysipelotrichaceae bacterium]|nr:peptide-methionine (S)-S-oxide reductase MsrA [Erysipelotrichaceae bacterium]